MQIIIENLTAKQVYAVKKLDPVGHTYRGFCALRNEGDNMYKCSLEFTETNTDCELEVAEYKIKELKSLLQRYIQHVTSCTGITQIQESSYAVDPLSEEDQIRLYSIMEEHKGRGGR